MVDELRRGAGSLQPNGDRMHEPVMPVEHVADAVVHTASLPLHVNILTQVRPSLKSPCGLQNRLPDPPASCRRSWRRRCRSSDEADGLRREKGEREGQDER